jgi:hypothetical protein
MSWNSGPNSGALETAAQQWGLSLDQHFVWSDILITRQTGILGHAIFRAFSNIFYKNTHPSRMKSIGDFISTQFLQIDVFVGRINACRVYDKVSIYGNHSLTNHVLPMFTIWQFSVTTKTSSSVSIPLLFKAALYSMLSFQGWRRQCTRSHLEAASTHCWRQRHSATALTTYAMNLVTAWMPWRRTDMTIHWKAIEEHFLTGPLVFLFNFNHFRGKMHFLNFSPKTSLLNESTLIYLFLISSGRPRRWHFGCPPRYIFYRWQLVYNNIYGAKTASKIIKSRSVELVFLFSSKTTEAR